MHKFLISAALIVSASLVNAQTDQPKFEFSQSRGDLKVESINAEALLFSDAEKQLPAGAIQYGVSHPVQQWLDVASPTHLQSKAAFSWQVNAPGATSVDLVFSHYWVPAGVSVYVYDKDRQWVRGPYTDQHNNAQNVLPMPFVTGDTAIIEVVGDAESISHAKLQVGTITSGYREFWKPGGLQKSGSCNVDVACPERQGWEDQIASVGHYTFTSGGSSFVCSGQMLNTTGNDDDIFSTAFHCLSTQTEASTMVVYFNYESPTCRAPGSAASGNSISRNGFSDTIEGTTLVASYDPSDFTLVRLNQTPPQSYNVYYSGWDRTGNGLAGVTGIHHPAGHAKRISIENDELCKAPYLQACNGASTHWRVSAWDSGTTEGGSSGSGIWNPNGLFVGQLEGGFAACENGSADDNDQPDWYGRMDVSWTGGGSEGSRMSDALDPGNLGSLTMAGRGGCDAPLAQIASSKGGILRVGESNLFSASASGGQGPYSFAWDVDGDGIIDSTESSVTAIYHEAFTGNVILGITDATGCRASAAFGAVVQAPSFQVSSVGSPMQMCGNGDSQMDPGEAWNFPVTLQNSGAASPSSTFAAFSTVNTPTAAAKRFGGPDNFGYTFADSQESACNFSFQDISSSGTELSFSQANTAQDIPALDDGFADVNLGGSGFDFYGENITRVTVSTNGYLATDLNDNGGDFSNDCPLPSTSDNSGSDGRIYPLHDDVIANAVYHQYFPTCPRPGESLGSAGCDVFQWNADGFFQSTAGLNFDFQAILYEGTNQIVYQYGSGNERNGTSQTVGIQNRPGAAAPSDGLTYACETPNSVPDNSAVCIFHPSADSPGLSSEVSLLSSAVPLGATGNGASSQVNVTVKLNESFSCGDGFSADYLGTVHSDGFSGNASPSAITGQVPQSCNVVTSCRNIGEAAIEAREGFWFNPLRPGNGIDLHFADDKLYSAWYTAQSDRLPLWYYVTSVGDQALTNNSVDADILRFRLNGDITQTAPTGTTVGNAQISFVSDSEAVMTFTINGESNGELIRFFDLSSTSDVDPVITDQYFNADESGWGIGTHRQGNQEFSAVYFYGTDGEPRWVVVTSDGTALTSQGTADLSSFKAHCPGCTWTPVSILNGGTMERTLNADGSALLNALDVQVNEDVSIQWNRSNLPLQQITPPN
ncbi:MAG: hypothetical protein AB8B96_13980 [Lysobacterales bacterium]